MKKSLLLKRLGLSVFWIMHPVTYMTRPLPANKLGKHLFVSSPGTPSSRRLIQLACNAWRANKNRMPSWKIRYNCKSQHTSLLITGGARVERKSARSRIEFQSSFAALGTRLHKRCDNSEQLQNRNLFMTSTKFGKNVFFIALNRDETFKWPTL